MYTLNKYIIYIHWNKVTVLFLRKRTILNSLIYIFLRAMIRDDVYADEEEGFRTVTATPADLQLRKPLHLSNNENFSPYT